MSNFKPWVDTPTEGQQVLSSADFITDIQRINGFKTGEPASSRLVNSGLRQSNLVCAALMEYMNSVVELPAALSLMSTISQVQNAIKNSIDKKHLDTLTSAKTYTNERETVINQKIQTNVNDITTVRNTVNSNKTSSDNKFAQIDRSIENINAAISDGSGTASTLRQDLNNLISLVNVLKTPYERTISINDWQGNTGNFSYTITASMHNKGIRPSIATYVNGEQTYDSPKINLTNGDVTLYSNAKIALLVVIK